MIRPVPRLFVHKHDLFAPKAMTRGLENHLMSRHTPCLTHMLARDVCSCSPKLPFARIKSFLWLPGPPVFFSTQTHGDLASSFTGQKIQRAKIRVSRRHDDDRAARGYLTLLVAAIAILSSNGCQLMCKIFLLKSI